MTEPNWRDIDVVRDWLGSRYPVANGRTGSPLFQYLQDEQAKGNKIAGLETRLSWGPGGEFRKWVWENSEDSVFHYSADAMQTPYYPEYVDQVSISRSQTPTHDEDTTIHKSSDLPSGLPKDHANCKRSKKRAQQKPQTTKPVRKSKNAKSSPAESTTTKKSRRKTLPRASRPQAAKQMDSKISRLQEERISTLRPGRNRKHRKTGRTDCTPLRAIVSNAHL